MGSRPSASYSFRSSEDTIAVGSRFSAAAKAAFARLHRNAVEVPGPATEVLCRAARRHRVHRVMGMTERDAEFSRGTLFNSLLFVSDAGEILGVHRKLVPTHSERVIWG